MFGHSAHLDANRTRRETAPEHEWVERLRRTPGASWWGDGMASLPRTLPFAWVPVAIGAVLVVPVVASLDGTAQWATLAAVSMAVVWSQLGSLVAWAGAEQLVAADGEPTIADVLRHKRHDGWKLVHGTSLAQGRRIDHIAVGPGGVVVVETKWRRDPTLGDLEWAAAKVQRHQRTVATVLRPVLGEVPVVPVIVTASAGDAAEGHALPTYVGGVRVIAVEDLAAWLEVFDTPRLTATKVAACHALLVAEAAHPAATSVAA